MLCQVRPLPSGSSAMQKWKYLVAQVMLNENLELMSATISNSDEQDSDSVEVEMLERTLHLTDFLTDLGARGWELATHSALRTGKHAAVLVFKQSAGYAYTPQSRLNTP